MVWSDFLYHGNGELICIINAYFLANQRPGTIMNRIDSSLQQVSNIFSMYMQEPRSVAILRQNGGHLESKMAAILIRFKMAAPRTIQTRYMSSNVSN